MEDTFFLFKIGVAMDVNFNKQALKQIPLILRAFHDPIIISGYSLRSFWVKISVAMNPILSGYITGSHRIYNLNKIHLTMTIHGCTIVLRKWTCRVVEYQCTYLVTRSAMEVYIINCHEHQMSAALALCMGIH